jgi:hypothetical protein
MTSSHSASTSSASLARLSDRDLLRALHQLTARDREVEAELLAHLGEVDARGLYLEEGCASMFAYCTEVPPITGSRLREPLEPIRWSWITCAGASST